MGIAKRESSKELGIFGIWLRGGFFFCLLITYDIDNQSKFDTRYRVNLYWM